MPGVARVAAFLLPFLRGAHGLRVLDGEDEATTQLRPHPDGPGAALTAADTDSTAASSSAGASLLEASGKAAAGFSPLRAFLPFAATAAIRHRSGPTLGATESQADQLSDLAEAVRPKTEVMIMLPEVWARKFADRSLTTLGANPASGVFQARLACDKDVRVSFKQKAWVDSKTKREIRMMRHLQDMPGVVAYYEHMVLDADVFVLTEATDNYDLDLLFHEHMDEEPQVRPGEPWTPIKESLPLLVDLLRGAQSLQKSGVVHLGLTDDRAVLLTRSDEESRYRAVIDELGDACIIEGSKEELRRLGPDAVLKDGFVGSAYHLPPEMKDFRPTGYENNVWQVGLLFGKMLFGSFPTDKVVLEHLPDALFSMMDYEEKGRQQIHAVIEKHFRIRQDPAFQQLEAKHPDIAEVVAGLLEIDPEKRWTADQAMVEVSKVMQKHSISVPPRPKRAALPEAWYDDLEEVEYDEGDDQEED